MIIDVHHKTDVGFRHQQGKLLINFGDFVICLCAVGIQSHDQGTVIFTIFLNRHWDSDQFQSFFRNSHIVLLTYDIGNPRQKFLERQAFRPIG